MDRIDRIVPLLKARAGPGMRSILGGPEVAPIPADILSRHLWADWVAYADEGEEVFRLFLRALALGDGPIEKTPGMAFRHGGRIVKTPLPDFIDLDAAPPLYGRWNGGRPPTCILETSRGCSLTCKYCDWGDRKMRYVSIERLREEFRAAAKLSDSISLTDADILMHRSRGKAIIEAFLESTAGNSVLLGFNTNPAFLHRDIVDILARAPRKFSLHLGVQSTNPKALALIDRHFDRAKVEENLDYLIQAAPETAAAIQLIFGLPGDDLDGYRRSLDWGLRVLAKHEFGGFLESSPLLVLPGAAVYREARELGLIYSSLPPYVVQRTATMDEADIQRAFWLCGSASILSGWPDVRKMLLPLANWASSHGHELPYVTLIEEWGRFLEDRGLGLTGGSRHFDVGKTRRRLAEDAVSRAAILLATRRFAERFRSDAAAQAPSFLGLGNKK